MEAVEEEPVDPADAFYGASDGFSSDAPEVAMAPAEVSLAAATSSRPRSKVKSARPAPSNRMLPPSASLPPVSGGAFPTHIAGGAKRCVCCGAMGRDYHPLYSCRPFLRLSEPERQTLVQENHVCRLCMGSGQYAKGCQSQGRCADSSSGQACGGRHHTLMHTPRGTMGPPAPMVTQ